MIPPSLVHLALLASLSAAVSPCARGEPPPGCSSSAGLTLPEGFCAVLVGQRLGPVRHLLVAPNGDIFAAIKGRDGGVLALRDTTGDGVADVRQHFGPGDGGTGIALGGGYLYFSTDSRVVRWSWKAGQLSPAGDFETIVQDLPASGDHTSKSIALGPDGALYVNLGSATNSCQESNRRRRSPGIDPCVELLTRAGLWRFQADRTGQRLSDGVRFATGLRNSVALAVHPVTGKLYAAPHGRDQLGDNWGFTDEQNAELPAEELVQPESGDDFGWPYCYFDQQVERLVLAPEYHGDGQAVGRCADKKPPLIGFPGHWGPMDLAFATGTQFPESYQGGVFIAFHGSWNRAPLPQAGYRVVYAPFVNGKPTGSYATFARGKNATDLRVSGLAVGPDGSLYVASDQGGKLWKVMLSR